MVRKYDSMTKEELMQSQVVRVQEKGQVTIPLEIRQKLGLKKGDLVTFIETEAGVVIKPAEVIITEALDEVGKALEEKGVSLKEIMERAREYRGEMIEKDYGLSD
jgi:antitoxin PrlF